MSSIYPVPVWIEDVRLEPLMREVMASLPISLIRTDLVSGAVAAVAGGGDWPARAAAALAAGAAGVVVDDPDPVPASELDPLLSANQPVVLDRPYLSNPAIAPARDCWKKLDVPALLVDSDLLVPTAADPRGELFRHVSLVRAVAGPLIAANAAAIGATGYSVAATLESGLTAILAGALTDAGLARVNLRLLGSPHRLTLTVFTPSTADAATVFLVDAERETMLPTLYENGHRASWRRMITALRDGFTEPDLGDFARDVTAFDMLLEVAAR
jgi:hypothetical protein